jgi:O-methyltransferase involved in polyketide biosynthesis
VDSKYLSVFVHLHTSLFGAAEQQQLQQHTTMNSGTHAAHGGEPQHHAYQADGLNLHHQQQIRSIMATANDAILAKQATVLAGYYKDPFLGPFCQSNVEGVATGDGGIAASGRQAPSPPPQQQQRRRQFQPIIKRGTHARVCCMDRIISTFLDATVSTNNNNSFSSSSSNVPQIVVLGAGKDTSFFRYRAGLLNGNTTTTSTTTSNENNNDKTKSPNVHWFEVDQMALIQDKAKTIQASDCAFFNNKTRINKRKSKFQPTPHGYRLEIRDQFAEEDTMYTLLGHDLTDSPLVLLDKLQLNTDAPTLFLLECVLMYLPDASTRELLQAMSTASDDTLLACFEPILGSDAFGQVMERNLVKAQIATPTSCLLTVRTLPAQLEKLVACGFSSHAMGCDMWSAYETIMTQEQRQRANQCEFLDELEEWMLIMRHYCFLVGHGGKQPSGAMSEKYCCVGPDSPLGFVAGKCQVVSGEGAP